MTIKALYPASRPSLDLNFARTKALDPRITYTRASTGTFVGSDGFIKNAASGAARFDHNPTTGESLGLLVEEARTNLLTYSEQFDNAAWDIQISNIASRDPNVTTAPDGTLTADRITAQNAVSGAFLYRGVGTTASHTISCYVKKDTSNWFAFSNAGFFAFFNIATGALGTVQDGTATIISVGNNWYKCNWTPATVSFNYNWRFRIATNNGAPDANGESVFLWGAQVEAGSFPTSYIPTTSATVTRATDVASVPTTGWMDTTGGTILAEYYKRIPIQGDGNYIWSLGGGNPMIMDGWKTELDFSAGMMNVAAPVVAGKNKIIFKFEQGNYAVSSNGSAVSTSTLSTAWGSVPSSLQIATGGAVPFGKKGLHAPIARLTYYPTRLSDAQLITLTR